MEIPRNIKECFKCAAECTEQHFRNKVKREEEAKGIKRVNREDGSRRPKSVKISNTPTSSRSVYVIGQFNIVWKEE